ncbi:ribonuclease HII [Citricoccus sp. SGAir0253]|uniref:ribonuclease HII n=1 Tax=Citricoccus sp. SGAir0253 TaxID=2567881 RepID=UPI0010CD3396|nr:ribonuclease HII [Citricoccus sp. SGAir0253]QCU78335.1 ribonuclease HII [Citricoccus sp. SGAir0253]
MSTPAPARTRRSAARRTPAPLPGLDLEASLVAGRPQGGALVAGMDEVGRGALAGPVSVGVVVVRLPDAGPVPAVRDSKALSPARREALVPEVLAWGAAAAVGHAAPGEIDRYGISGALALAGRRAWHEVVTALGAQPDALVLDGRDDWLPRAPRPECAGLAAGPGRVHLQVKADARCATVAAASILAKVERDALMTRLAAEHPAYGWDGNKGYGAAAHRRALVERGPSPHHRLSWRLLPGAEAPGTAAPADPGRGTARMPVPGQSALSWDGATGELGAEWTA